MKKKKHIEKRDALEQQIEHKRPLIRWLMHAIRQSDRIDLLTNQNLKKMHFRN